MGEQREICKAEMVAEWTSAGMSPEAVDKKLATKAGKGELYRRVSEMRRSRKSRRDDEIAHVPGDVKAAALVRVRAWLGEHEPKTLDKGAAFYDTNRGKKRLHEAIREEMRSRAEAGGESEVIDLAGDDQPLSRAAKRGRDETGDDERKEDADESKAGEDPSEPTSSSTPATPAAKKSKRPRSGKQRAARTAARKRAERDGAAKKE